MNDLYDNKIIIACSSGHKTNSAIALIRLSGKFQLNEFQAFFSKKLIKIKPRKMYQSKLIQDDEVLDEIMFCFFQAPLSYTGENLLELYVHGNLLNIKRIVRKFCLQNNIRLARPGEFTYRAIINKKLDLSQAEGLDLFLNSTNSMALKQGIEILSGSIHKKFLNLYEMFKNLKIAFELQIDFLEDIGEQPAEKILSNAISNFEEALLDLYNKTKGEVSHLISPTVVIIGQANAGKSTFFNNFLGKNRSIVSPIKGTTRDYISDYIIIDDNQFQLIDTAGIRKTSDEIEKEGIIKTKQLITDAFFNILIINPFQTEKHEFEEIDFTKIDMILISHADIEKCYEESLKFSQIQSINKYFTNLVEVTNSGPIGPKTNSGPIGPKTNNGPIGPEVIYSQELKQIIEQKINNKYKKITSNETFFIERQKNCIIKTYNKYLKFKEILKHHKDIGICLNELSVLENEISQLIGIVKTDSVLNEIFSNFCIGK